MLRRAIRNVPPSGMMANSVFPRGRAPATSFYMALADGPDDVLFHLTNLFLGGTASSAKLHDTAWIALLAMPNLINSVNVVVTYFLICNSINIYGGFECLLFQMSQTLYCKYFLHV